MLRPSLEISSSTPALIGGGFVIVRFMTFTDRLNARIALTNSRLCLGLDPRPAMHPSTENGDRRAIHRLRVLGCGFREGGNWW